MKHVFEVREPPDTLPLRVTCDSRYVLYVNGRPVGRGPVRGEPEHLGWDEHDVAGDLVPGRNVLVALCRYYGTPGPWWIPASPLGTLGRGSFCLETSVDAAVEVLTGSHWLARSAPWVSGGTSGMHSFPPEIVDGRQEPAGLHDPGHGGDGWSGAVVVSGHGHGTVLDRPPAAPYMTPLRRPIPQMTSTRIDPRPVGQSIAIATVSGDPVATWHSIEAASDGDRHVTVWDLGKLSLGHVSLRVTGAGIEPGEVVDLVGGEDLREDGLPEIHPREWAARYVLGASPEQSITFFDPVGLRYIAAHAPPDVEVSVGFEEAIYPRTSGASFEASDGRYSELWRVGLRTVDVCSTDAFLDCPGREQRAWVSDAYPQILVSLVTNPDQRLVRHHLDLTSRSRFPGGLLAGAAACDFARIGFTMPEYSLHWIRSLSAYWRYSGDEGFVRRMLPVADGIIERYERQRGPSGLLEDFPGWVFLDWAQVDRDMITGAHDAFYAAAL
ncbi:MAG: hypothetical protein KY437_00680, partial [Actinobacteria bacterium]|nr:hypothetical protein [Actinomycetota bacterium]